MFSKPSNVPGSQGVWMAVPENECGSGPRMKGSVYSFPKRKLVDTTVADGLAEHLDVQLHHLIPVDRGSERPLKIDIKARNSSPPDVPVHSATVDACGPLTLSVLTWLHGACARGFAQRAAARAPSTRTPL